jgi:Arc/MetJ-type ribon-helix-helix transcriptional regulator
MSIVQLELSEHLEKAIDRQIAQRRFASRSGFLLEAARRLAEILELKDLTSAAALSELEEIELEVRATAEAQAGFR